jgi:hypothetical protein
MREERSGGGEARRVLRGRLVRREGIRRRALWRRRTALIRGTSGGRRALVALARCRTWSVSRRRSGKADSKDHLDEEGVAATGVVGVGGDSVKELGSEFE